MRRIAAFMLMGLTVVGCGAQRWKGEPSGFLSNYDDLSESKGEPGVLRFEQPGGLARYASFIVEPIAVQPRPDGNLERSAPEEIHRLASEFTLALRAELDERYEVVEQPGPGVLRLRGAITDVDASAPALNIHPATKLSGFGLGGASFEAEGVDALTGERVFAVVVSRRAAKRIGSGLGEWDDARQVMRDWAAQFRRRVDNAHAEDDALGVR